MSSSSIEETSSPYPELSNECIYEMQNERFKVFKSQDLEKGHFDVSFEIEGKILHAHKFILTSISEPIDAMLSSRWMKKDEPVKIKTFSYDNFYQFLRFLYSGSCILNNDNVFQLADMAEFFGVPCLKKFCDRFLYDVKITTKNIEELYEFADKYSMTKLIESIKRRVISFYGKEIFKLDTFLAFKKPFIQFLSTIERDSDYGVQSYVWRPDKNHSSFFELAYKWAEHQIIKQQSIGDENFNLQEAIKTELYTIIPDPKFDEMNLEFLRDFVLEKGFILSPKNIQTFFIQFKFRGYSNYDDEEAHFNPIYELVEKQGIKKQIIAAQNGESFNLADSVKADLGHIIPRVKFYKMGKTYLADFVVAKGILTKEQGRRVYDICVNVENNGNSISGVFNDDLGIFHAVQKKPCERSLNSTTKIRFPKLKFTVPKTPNTLKKMKDVVWYLCLEETGILTFKHYSKIDRNDYLLAEMKSDTEFQLISNAMTKLTASRIDIFD